MDFQTIIQAISAVGFPIVFCVIVYKTMVDSIKLFNDKLTLEEMLTFIRNEKGRMEAKNGAHDDLVMALAIRSLPLKT